MTTEPSLDTLLLTPQTQDSKWILASAIHQDERPLQGELGLLDWRIRGLVSKFLKLGKVSGKVGEVAYLPFEHHGQLRHLLLLGLGPKSSAPNTKAVEDGLVESVRKMGFSKLVVSRSGFPFIDVAHLRKRLLTGNSPIEVEAAK